MDISKKKSSRNGTIEFFRFVFCMGVLLFHIGKYIIGEPSLKNGVHLALFPHGALGVEFFFILTGLFLAQSVYKEINNRDNKDIGESTIYFMKRKISSIFSFHIIAYIILFIILIFTEHYGIKKIILTFIESIPSIFFLQMSGIPCKSLNHIEWYLSVMFISLAIIYPICKKYFSYFCKIGAPLLALIILGYLGYTYHSLTGVKVWTGIAYKSMFRGISEILLGIWAYDVAIRLRKININKFYKIFLTILEFLSYIFVTIIMLMTFKRYYEFYALIFIFIAIVLSYSGVTYSKNIFSLNIFNYLGSLSMPIYLSQLSAITLVSYLFTNYSINYQVISAVVLTFIFALVTKKLCELLTKFKQ